jgi:hypothetical protein
MFPTNRDRLLLIVVASLLLAIIIIVLPTIILLGIVGGRIVKVTGGDAIVDASLGTILVFSSLAAVAVPFAYRSVPL